MGYRFKLEALRRYRRFQEEELQKELSDAQRHQEREARKLFSLEEKRCQTEADLKESRSGNTNSTQLVIFDDYLRRLAQEIKEQRMQLHRAETHCDQKREALMLGMQKRKTLEKLKEKEFKTYLRNLDQEEAKFINEMAISRFRLISK